MPHAHHRKKRRKKGRRLRCCTCVKYSVAHFGVGLNVHVILTRGLRELEGSWRLLPSFRSWSWRAAISQRPKNYSVHPDTPGEVDKFFESKKIPWEWKVIQSVDSLSLTIISRHLGFLGERRRIVTALLSLFLYVLLLWSIVFLRG